jgi:hypothetical protein
MSDVPVQGAQSTTPPRRSRRKAAVVALVIVTVMVVGAVVAATVPVYAVAAQSNVAAMLPASTPFYLSVDLNPTGATKSGLDQIESAFTGERGWAHNSIVRFLRHSTQAKSSAGDCYRGDGRQALSSFSELGHQTTLAVTSLKGVPRANAQSETADAGHAVRRDIVVVAPLNIHETLVQALTSAFSLSWPKQAGSYKGTTIYSESLHSCSQASGGASGDTLYAALVKGWAVIGVTQAALRPVIDTANGSRPSLAHLASYSKLESPLPQNQLVGYYFNGTKLKPYLNSEHFSTLSEARIVSPLMGNSLKPTAGAVSVDGPKISFTMAATHGEAGSARPGQLLRLLPSNMEMFLSIGNAKQVLQQFIRQATIEGVSTPKKELRAIHDIESTMSGEADIVLLHPNASIEATAGTLPAAVVWRVSDDTKATKSLLGAVRATGSRPINQPSPEGNYYSFAQDASFGFFVKNGWSVATLNAGAWLNEIHTRTASAAERPMFEGAVPSGADASSVFYVDATALRQSIERAFRSQNPSGTLWRAYVTTLRPMVSPIKRVYGSSGDLGAQGYTQLTVVFR